MDDGSEIQGRRRRLRRCDEGPEELVTTTEALEEEDEPEVLAMKTEAYAEEAEKTTRPSERL